MFAPYVIVHLRDLSFVQPVNEIELTSIHMHSVEMLLIGVYRDGQTKYF